MLPYHVNDFLSNGREAVQKDRHAYDGSRQSVHGGVVQHREVTTAILAGGLSFIPQAFIDENGLCSEDGAYFSSVTYRGLR